MTTDQIYDSNYSRRRFITTTAFALGSIPAATSVLSSCRSDSKPTATVDLSFYGTGTLDIEEKRWKNAREAGVAVSFSDNKNDVGPVIAQMVTGNAAKVHDVGGLQGGAERELFAAGAIVPWDLVKIPNWARVWDEAKAISYTKSDGRQLGLPIAINADSIIYMPEMLRTLQGYKGPLVIDSYAAIFDPQLKGRVSMEDAWINSAIFAAMYLKGNPQVGIGINDPGDLSESELREVMEFLIEHKKRGQFLKLWRGWEQGVDILNSGEVVAMTGWEPIVYALRDKGKNAQYAVPKEGYEGWTNDLILHSGASQGEKYEAAHRFANWLYNGYYGAALAHLRGYAVPSELTAPGKGAQNEFTEGKVVEVAKNVRQKVTPTDLRPIYYQNVRPKNHRLYDEWWTKLRLA